MVDKELRRLKRKDLLQMLVMQCEEAEKLQQKVDQTNARLRELEVSYERLKAKLDVKDDRLNQKDAKIAELRRTVQKLKTSREIELKEAGSIAEAALQLNGIFEAAQKAADQYLMNVMGLADTGQITAKDSIKSSIHVGERRKTLKYKWGQDTWRKLLHG